METVNPYVHFKMLRMISVMKATESDYNLIVSIGKISVAESHRGSCSAEDMNEFLERNYNSDAIKEELSDINNIYYIINYNDKPVGFSKIILNAKHPNIIAENVTKLDRIYLLKEYYGLKLGLELLNGDGYYERAKKSIICLLQSTKVFSPFCSL